MVLFDLAFEGELEFVELLASIRRNRAAASRETAAGLRTSSKLAPRDVDAVPRNGCAEAA